MTRRYRIGREVPIVNINAPPGDKKVLIVVLKDKIINNGFVTFVGVDVEDPDNGIRYYADVFRNLGKRRSDRYFIPRIDQQAPAVSHHYQDAIEKKASIEHFLRTQKVSNTVLGVSFNLQQGVVDSYKGLLDFIKVELDKINERRKQA